MKCCVTCEGEKPLAEFYANKVMRDGLQSSCKPCLNARSKRRYRAVVAVEKPRRLQRTKEWRNRNRERLSAYNKAYHAATREKQLAAMWRRRLQKKYQITPEDYEALRASQGGKCAICATLAGERDLVVDHDHTTKAVRGLLCDPCNKALGFFRDSPQRMVAAAFYVKRRRSIAA